MKSYPIKAPQGYPSYESSAHNIQPMKANCMIIMTGSHDLSSNRSTDHGYPSHGSSAQIIQPMEAWCMIRQAVVALLMVSQPMKSSFHGKPTNEVHSRVSQPMKAHSRVSQPMKAHSMVSQPMKAHSLVSQPMNAHPLVSQPIKAHSRVSQPMKTHSIVSQPIAEKRKFCSGQICIKSRRVHMPHNV